MKNRLTRKEKNADDKKWYKEMADTLQKYSMSSSFLESDKNVISDTSIKKMKINYDLYNNKLNLDDFNYVINDLKKSKNLGDMPANLTNKNIVTPKIDAVLGIEQKKAFKFSVVANNEEVLSHKEEVHYNMIKDYVISEIIRPLKQQILMEKAQQLQGRKLSNEEQQQLMAEVEQELEQRKPEAINRYMQREYKAPIEVMSNQLLNYLSIENNLKHKFNKAFKHGLLSGKEIMYIGVLNKEPFIEVVNPLHFYCDSSNDIDFIEDNERAVCWYYMTPSEIIKRFGDELKEEDIDKIYETDDSYKFFSDYDYGYNYNTDRDNVNDVKIAVAHCVWKSLKKVVFLTYIDVQGIEHTTVVDEAYKLNKESGDIKIKVIWIPTVYETWKIGNDIYVYMQELPTQFKDINDLYYCKLPYYGVIHNNMNSDSMSLMDNLKEYQYFYNIVFYRIELLLASDKGKKVLLNADILPDNEITLKEWTHLLNQGSIAWFSPTKKGNYTDIVNAAKEIDLSLASDIQKYIQLLNFIREQAGRAVGIPDAMEGQINAYETATNTRQTLIQSSNMLEGYFDLHFNFKRNVLQGLLDVAKVAYSNSNQKKLSYILDDYSTEILNLDVGLLNSSTLGVYINYSSKEDEIKEQISQLAHASLQNQKIELSDLVSVLRKNSLIEAEEVLENAEIRKRTYEQQMQQQEQEFKKQMEKMKYETQERLFQQQKELIVLKEEEERKTESMKLEVEKMKIESDMLLKEEEQSLKANEQGIKIDEQNRKYEIDKNKSIQDNKKEENNEKERNRKAKTDEEKLELERQKLALQKKTPIRK